MATANLSVESKDFTLPVVEATAGADGIVVSTLRNDGWVVNASRSMSSTSSGATMCWPS